MASKCIEEKGIKRTEDGGIFCEACGADISAPNSTRFAMHLDGTKFYENRFTCTACGALLSQMYARSKAEQKWWG